VTLLSFLASLYQPAMLVIGPEGYVPRNRSQDP